MRRSPISIKAWLGAILALACYPLASRAGFDAGVTASYTKISDGLYQYTYTVTAGPTNTVPISEFDLAVNDPVVGLTSITAPSDFIPFYTQGDTSISFIAFDAGITVGNTGVFSFISTSLPGLVADQLFGQDPSTFAPNFIQANIVGPATVPEPSSLLLCGLGAIALGLVARSRGRRTSPSTT